MKLMFLFFLIFYFDDMKLTNFLYHLVRSKKRGADINTQFRSGEITLFFFKKYIYKIK